MIARIWRGLTRPEQSDAYAAYVEETGIAEYRATPGNRGALILRREDEGAAEFVVISFWEDFDAIRRFAGDDVEKAVYYPEDDKFLLGHEPKVAHYEIAAGDLPSGGLPRS